MMPQYNGPIWIDPRYLDRMRWGWSETVTKTTTTTTTQPVDDARIRKIVREEIAELPIQFEVPDEPPKDENDG